MLTIKHVENSGVELINTADSVAFMPKDDLPKRLMAFGGSCNLSGDYSQYQSGIIYVMNAAGKTVGVYHLD